MLFGQKEEKYVSDGRDGAIGHIRNLLAKGEYKICPQCGRIFPLENNYCSMCCNGEKLTNTITIEIK